MYVTHSVSKMPALFPFIKCQQTQENKQAKKEEQRLSITSLSGLSRYESFLRWYIFISSNPFQPHLHDIRLGSCIGRLSIEPF